MLKIKRFLKENKTVIFIVAILLICSIAIAFGVYAQVTHRKQRKSEEERLYANYEELKTNFQKIFTNKINVGISAKSGIKYEELLYTSHHIKEEKEGKFKIEAYMPEFKGDTQTLRKINDDIYNEFGKEMLNIYKKAKINTTYNLDYVGYVNNNIISLAIMCKYKDGEKAQRKIVKCYNYDIENDKLLTIDDLIEYRDLDKENMQKRITEEIKTINNQKKSVNDQGYNFSLRDEDSEIYKVENTPNFFLGKNNYLYLVYAYGNDDYTSEIDLIIF